MYTQEFHKPFKAVQGLKSPIRNTKGLPSLLPKQGFDIILTIGITFTPSQLNDHGWFIDNDKVLEELDKMTTYLASKQWTKLFDFRPTFELVSRWIYHELEKNMPQMIYVSIDNLTLGVKTRFQS